MENNEQQKVDINDLFVVIEEDSKLEVGRYYADTPCVNGNLLSSIGTIFKYAGVTGDNRLKFEYVAGDNGYKERDGFTHFFNPNSWTLVEPK